MGPDLNKDLYGSGRLVQGKYSSVPALKNKGVYLIILETGSSIKDAKPIIWPIPGGPVRQFARLLLDRACLFWPRSATIQ